MNAAALIKNQEELRLKPYDDATGKTIVVGTIIKGKISVGFGINISDGITIEEAQMLFDGRFDAAVRECRKYDWFPALSVARQAGVISMMFNLGARGFAGFHQFIRAMDAGDYEWAERELRNSDWYSEVPMRAAEIINLIRHEVWPT
jgi:lysozyme